MARTTFDGPILSGANRTGPLRNVGYTDIVQSAFIDLSVTANGTALYGGGSGQFVSSSIVPNQNAPVYVPSATAYPPALRTIPADTATNVYRGVVMYLPAGCVLNDAIVDCGAIVAVAGGTASLTSATVYVSNDYTVAAGTPTYYATGAISAVGRQALATLTATQITNQTATSSDITNPPSGIPGGGQGTDSNSSLVSQVVFTLAIVGTTLDTRTSLTGRFYFRLRYTQLDPNIGNLTAYPYGNFA
jgi:hypothetical protein